MIQSSAIRRYVYEAVPYASHYPDRLRCNVDGDKIRIAQYTATDYRNIDDATFAFAFNGTIHRYDVLLTEVLEKHGIKVHQINKIHEPDNKTKVLAITFSEVPKMVTENKKSSIVGYVLIGVIVAILSVLAIFV